MSKEITKANILQEIQDKFKMRELTPEIFRFSEEVLPIYDIGPHLMKPEVKTTIVSITSADSFLFYIVPDTERWHLHGYNVIFMTGDYTVAGVIVSRFSILTDWFYLDLEAAQAASYIHVLPKDVVLSPGHKIYVNVDGYTNSGNLDLRLDVTVEEIR